MLQAQCGAVSVYVSVTHICSGAKCTGCALRCKPSTQAQHRSPAIATAQRLTHEHTTPMMRKANRREAGNLVAQALGLDVRHLIADALVGVKIERKLLIVLLNKHTRCTLDGLRTDASLQRTDWSEWRVSLRGCVRRSGGKIGYSKQYNPLSTVKGTAQHTNAHDQAKAVPKPHHLGEAARVTRELAKKGHCRPSGSI